MPLLYLPSYVLHADGQRWAILLCNSSTTPQLCCIQLETLKLFRIQLKTRQLCFFQFKTLQPCCFQLKTHQLFLGSAPFCSDANPLLEELMRKGLHFFLAISVFGEDTCTVAEMAVDIADRGTKASPALRMARAADTANDPNEARA